MERSVSPLHVHVGRKTPVHVHLKSKRPVCFGLNHRNCMLSIALKILPVLIRGYQYDLQLLNVCSSFEKLMSFGMAILLIHYLGFK